MFQALRVPVLLLITYSLLMIVGGHWVWNTSHQSLLNDHQSKLDRFFGSYFEPTRQIRAHSRAIIKRQRVD